MSSRGYLALAIGAAVVAIAHTATFVVVHGFDVEAFVSPLFELGMPQVVALDLLLLTVAFLAWSWSDARRRDIRGWWIVLLSTVFVAVSCGVPLYLFLRELRREAASAA